MGRFTVQSDGVKLARGHWQNFLILLVLSVIIFILNKIEPFHRFVGEEMMTEFKYPFKPKDTIPFWAVPFIAVLFPMCIFVLFYFTRKDVYDLHHAIVGILFSVLINGVITDAIKDAVGRPRPNFFHRCFPDGNAIFDVVTHDVVCNGDPKITKEGYKSFPSGHASWSFAGLVFLSWYLAGKIRILDHSRGHVSKLCVVLLPVLGAALVGVSRVDDYWHHWTDVFAGALIGTIVATICYLHFFPFPHESNGWASCAYFRKLGETNVDISKGVDNLDMPVPMPETENSHAGAPTKQEHEELEEFKNGTREIIEV